jgi:DNA repair exonuclease SbcCD ATPase subunit
MADLEGSDVELLGMAEVLALYRCSRNTVRKALNEGRVEGAHMADRGDGVQQWLMPTASVGALWSLKDEELVATLKARESELEETVRNQTDRRADAERSLQAAERERDSALQQVAEISTAHDESVAALTAEIAQTNKRFDDLNARWAAMDAAYKQATEELGRVREAANKVSAIEYKDFRLSRRGRHTAITELHNALQKDVGQLETGGKANP